jgi:hypothetical protein
MHMRTRTAPVQAPTTCPLSCHSRGVPHVVISASCHIPPHTHMHACAAPAQATITCALPGLYEVCFGFYGRKKPVAQLMVNGEPTLLAANKSGNTAHSPSSGGGHSEGQGGARARVFVSGLDAMTGAQDGGQAAGAGWGASWGAGLGQAGTCITSSHGASGHLTCMLA